MPNVEENVMETFKTILDSLHKSPADMEKFNKIIGEPPLDNALLQTVMFMTIGYSLGVARSQLASEYGWAHDTTDIPKATEMRKDDCCMVLNNFADYAKAYDQVANVFEQFMGFVQLKTAEKHHGANSNEQMPH